MDMHARLTVVTGLCLLPLAPLALRLTRLQVLEHGRLSSRVAGEVLRSMEESIPRARLLDRRGRLLAESVPYWSCFVERTRLAGRGPELARELSPLLAVSEREISRKLRDGRRTAYIKEDVSAAEVSKSTPAGNRTKARAGTTTFSAKPPSRCTPRIWLRTQNDSSPARQNSHSPQKILDWTATASPSER